MKSKKAPLSIPNESWDQVKKNLMKIFFIIIPKVPSPKQFFDTTTLVPNQANRGNFHILLQLLYRKFPCQPSNIYLAEWGSTHETPNKENNQVQKQQGVPQWLRIWSANPSLCLHWQHQNLQKTNPTLWAKVRWEWSLMT